MVPSTVTNHWIKQKPFIYSQLNVKTALFQSIQFIISTQFKCQNCSISNITLFSSIWPIDTTLSCATISGYCGPRNDGNEGVLLFPQISSVTGTSPLDFLVSYTGHLLGESYPSAEIQLVYSTSAADWTKYELGGIPVASVLDCYIVISEFEPQLCDYVRFQANFLGLILAALSQLACG